MRVSVPLKDGKPWLAIVADELFIHLNRTAYPSEAGFDQNRIFGGFGYKFGDARAELGYLNQYVRRFSDANQLNHCFVVNVVVSVGAAPAAPAALR
ncbi:MAG: DUF2490 domain-containing protein [Polyangiaceae bacterium]|nr:DUF2490 domain-containing protein [Polyangiaceae bacterium]